MYGMVDAELTQADTQLKIALMEWYKESSWLHCAASPRQIDIKLFNAITNYNEAVEGQIKIKPITEKEVHMDTYIGVKIVQAEPMVQDDKDGYKVVYEDGYTSWSPKDVFERAYRKVDSGQMPFGLAIEALRQDKKVARQGWNGKDMWLVLDPGTQGVILKGGPVYQRAGLAQVDINPHIDMFTAQGTMQPGWLASQTDMLSDDWFIVE